MDSYLGCRFNWVCISRKVDISHVRDVWVFIEAGASCLRSNYYTRVLGVIRFILYLRLVSINSNWRSSVFCHHRVWFLFFLIHLQILLVVLVVNLDLRDWNFYEFIFVLAVIRKVIILLLVLPLNIFNCIHHVLIIFNLNFSFRTFIAIWLDSWAGESARSR